MTIVRAAILSINGNIYSLPAPKRHHDVIHSMALNGMKTPIRGVQGFITRRGEFVNRVTAAKLALECGQIEKLISPPRLFSEDLW